MLDVVFKLSRRFRWKAPLACSPACQYEKVQMEYGCRQERRSTWVQEERQCHTKRSCLVQLFQSRTHQLISLSPGYFPSSGPVDKNDWKKPPLTRAVGRRNVFRCRLVEQPWTWNCCCTTLYYVLLFHTAVHYFTLLDHPGHSGCCYDEGLNLQFIHFAILPPCNLIFYRSGVVRDVLQTALSYLDHPQCMNSLGTQGGQFQT